MRISISLSPATCGIMQSRAPRYGGLVELVFRAPGVAAIEITPVLRRNERMEDAPRYKIITAIYLNAKGDKRVPG